MLVVKEADGIEVEQRLMRVFSTVPCSTATKLLCTYPMCERALKCTHCCVHKGSHICMLLRGTYLSRAVGEQSQEFLDKSTMCLEAVDAMAFVCDACDRRCGGPDDAADEDAEGGSAKYRKHTSTKVGPN